MRKLITWSSCAALAAAFCWTSTAQAVSVQIGDFDSFGYPTPISQYQAPDGGPADRNGDGMLTAGDTLADLNTDGSVATGRGDDFDHRTAAEAADPNLKWTDVALSTSFADRPGDPDDVLFTFNFTPPQPGDLDYNVDHFLNVVAGDLDTGLLQLTVDGENVPLQGVGTDDGLITLTFVDVPFSKLTDGELLVEFNTPGEPYVAIDYVRLDTQVAEVIPLPAAAPIGLLNLCLLAFKRRRHHG